MKAIRAASLTHGGPSSTKTIRIPVSFAYLVAFSHRTEFKSSIRCPDPLPLSTSSQNSVSAFWSSPRRVHPDVHQALGW